MTDPPPLAAHDAAVAAGQDGYLDPASGLFTMTAAYLLARGRCCGNDCRHCPYAPGSADRLVGPEPP